MTIPETGKELVTLGLSYQGRSRQKSQAMTQILPNSLIAAFLPQASSRQISPAASTEADFLLQLLAPADASGNLPAATPVDAVRQKDAISPKSEELVGAEGELDESQVVDVAPPTDLPPDVDIRPVPTDALFGQAVVPSFVETLLNRQATELPADFTGFVDADLTHSANPQFIGAKEGRETVTLVLSGAVTAPPQDVVVLLGGASGQGDPEAPAIAAKHEAVIPPAPLPAAESMAAKPEPEAVAQGSELPRPTLPVVAKDQPVDPRIGLSASPVVAKETATKGEAAPLMPQERTELVPIAPDHAARPGAETKVTVVPEEGRLRRPVSDGRSASVPEVRGAAQKAVSARLPAAWVYHHSLHQNPEPASPTVFSQPSVAIPGQASGTHAGMTPPLADVDLAGKGADEVIQKGSVDLVRQPVLGSQPVVVKDERSDEHVLSVTAKPASDQVQDVLPTDWQSGFKFRQPAQERSPVTSQASGSAETTLPAGRSDLTVAKQVLHEVEPRSPREKRNEAAAQPGSSDLPAGSGREPASPAAVPEKSTLSPDILSGSAAEESGLILVGAAGTGAERAPLPQALQHSPPQAGSGAVPPTAQIAEAVASLADGTVELRLFPEELGQVRIDMRRDGEVMVVQISAERQDTLDLLRRNAEQLAADLRASGHQAINMSFGRWSGSGRGSEQPPPSFEGTTAMAAADEPRKSQPFHPPKSLQSGLYLRI